MSELVTCVVPVRDGADHLAAALGSALAQTHPSLEVVVVDDGSRDGSGELAAAYGEPVRVVRREEPQGASRARAAGLAAARGAFVAFLDADDLWRPEKIAVQLEHLAGPPELDVSLAEIENFWEPGLEVEERHWRAHGRVRGGGVFAVLLARRAAFERVPPVAERRHSDSAAWLLRARAAQLRIGQLERVLSDRRRHGHNNSSRRIDAVYDDWFDLLHQRIAERRARG